MNRESNAYIILFSAVMVVVVGVSLALIAQVTKPNFIKNQRLEKMQNILSSVNIQVSPSEAEAAYEKYITGSVVYKMDGTLVEGVDAFEQVDLAKELKKPEDQQYFPLYECTKEDGKYFIIPMRGKGLWDAIWGYVAIKDDAATIAGAVFDHKGETPGLGAEIAKTPFQEQFPNKKIVDASGVFTGIEVAKAGKHPAGYEHGVDGISGGTITSNGVNDMLMKYLKAFRNYIEKNNVLQPVIQEPVLEELPLDSLASDSTTVIAE